MQSFEKIYDVVKSRLSEERFYHSVCVMERAIEYAKIYGVDEEIAKICGISHDIAKEIPKDKMLELADEYGIVLDDIEKKSVGLIHGKLGAEFCKREFGFTEDMANAVKYHTTGRENMSVLEKIIYIADLTGIDRTYESNKIGYELAKKDLDSALIFFFKKTIEKMIQEDKLIHLNTIKSYNYFLK